MAKKKSYIVSISVDGRIDIEVDSASSPEEAKRIAMSKFMDANLGDLECIDYKPVNATDEDDNLTDFV